MKSGPDISSDEEPDALELGLYEDDAEVLCVVVRSGVVAEEGYGVGLATDVVEDAGEEVILGREEIWGVALVLPGPEEGVDGGGIGRWRARVVVVHGGCK